MTTQKALLAKWPRRRGHPTIIERPEAKIAWFLSQGWKVIARDSDVYAPRLNPPRIVKARRDDGQ